MKNQIDINDFNHVLERSGVPIASQPCPQNKETGKINPHISQFTILGEHDQKVSVFHVKPIYYEHVSSTDENLVFRPMYEVCEHYGNHKVVFKYEKMLQIHPRYVEWLKKRMKLINGQVLVTSPFSSKVSPFNFAMEMAHKAVTKPTIGLTTTTVYPDPDPETTTVDGDVYNISSSTWSVVHDATTGDATTDSTTVFEARTEKRYNALWRISRIICNFDTSSIASGDTIDATTLSLYVTSTLLQIGGANAFGSIVQTQGQNMVSDTAINLADYSEVGDATPTEAHDTSARIAIGSLSNNAYNDWIFNATGRGWIAKSGSASPTGATNGITYLGLLTGHDLLNVAPSTSNTTQDLIPIASAENTGTTQDPKLIVTHTAGGTTVNVGVVSSIFSVPTYSTAGKARVSVNTQAILSSLPTVSVTGKAVVSPNTQTATFTVPAYSVVANGVKITPNTQTAVFSLPVREILYRATFNPTAQTITFNIPASSIKKGWKQSVSTQTVSVTVPSLSFVGSLWRRSARVTTGADWTRSSVNND